jgi:hypothetical protein
MAFDQTDPVWIRGNTEQTKGTGVKLVSNGTALSIELTPEITYEECAAAARVVIAWKWVPENVASFAQVSSSKCKTAGADCLDRCPGYCCFCLNGRCAP